VVIPVPERIQRKRIKGWRMPEGAVYVGRGSEWGNPYAVGDRASIITWPSVFVPRADRDRTAYAYEPTITREIAVLLFRVWVSDRLEDQIRHELAGKDLACWCPPDKPCHADVLLEIANSGSDGS
jgi:hypothetical protein